VGQDAGPGDRVQADVGRRCMVVDADPQGSLTLWHSIRADNGPVL
jgi:cellulose biosynthesis protein BcsQ